MSNDQDSKRPSDGEDAHDTKPEKKGIERRELITKVGAGVVGAALGAPVLMSLRSLVPNALYEKPQRFKAGKLEQFTEGPTFVPDQRVYIFREGTTFHCIGATCTHLGCTVQLVRTDGTETGQDYEFHCPCHGSKFREDGTNYSGPAPRPLDYFELDLAPDDGQLIVDTSKVADKGWRFSV
jgi:menaquinol-cytochrome c reductase iron-sulfur subunit